MLQRPDASSQTPTAAPDGARSALRARLWGWTKQALPIVFLVFALGLAAWAIQHELSAVSLADVGAAFGGLSNGDLALSALLVALSYVTLIGYDWSAFRYLKLPAPMGRLALGSFCGYAIANTAGFAVITGASARHRIHAAGGLTLFDAGRVALFSSTAFVVGITLLGGIGLLMAPDAVSDLVSLPARLIQPIGVGLIAATLIVMLYCALGRPIRIGRFSLPMPGFRLAVTQLVLSVIDVCLAGGALYVLMSAGTDVGISYFEFLAVYCAALTAGLLSHVPGGVGVFDAIILSAYGWRVGAAEALAALLAFRVLYYIAPFLIAAIVLAIVEVARHRSSSRLAPLARFEDIADGMAPLIGAIIAIGTGATLLAFGVTPAGAPRGEIFGAEVPYPLVETAHFLTSIVASTLLFLGVGLIRRLDAAFGLTIVALLLAAGLATIKGHSVYGIGAIVAMAVLLWPFRSAFRRETALFAQPLTGPWVVGIALVLASAAWLTDFAFSHQVVGDETWYDVALDDDAPRAWRALVGASVTAILIGITFLLRRPGRAF
ncbi:MAG: hypothetical protein AAF321_02230 [Pseudomonadota bacterium]